MRLTLPWPPSGLFPNRLRRSHWAVRSRLMKGYKADCYWAAKASGARILDVERLSLSLTFCPPDRRRRDLDGCLSAMKSGLDALAELVGVDDSRFALAIRMGEPVKGGAVIVEVAA